MLIGRGRLRETKSAQAKVSPFVKERQAKLDRNQLKKSHIQLVGMIDPHRIVSVKICIIFELIHTSHLFFSSS